MLIYIFILVSIFAFSDSFLLDSSGGAASQTDQHILGVIDLVVEEKRLRTQLEAAVTDLKHSHDQLTQRVSTLSTDLTLARQDNQQLSSKLQKLERDQGATENNVNTMQAQLHKGQFFYYIIYMY